MSTVLNEAPKTEAPKTEAPKTKADAASEATTLKGPAPDAPQAESASPANHADGGAKPPSNGGKTGALGQLDSIAKRMQRRRLISGAVSFALAVLLPLAAMSWYLYSVAEDQYATEFNFAVRGKQDLASGGDGLGVALGGANAIAGFADSFIVVDYIESLELVRELENRIGLRRIYAKAEDDWFHNFDPALPIEDLREYWQWKVHAEFDITRGIISAKVWTFDKADSLQVAEEVLKLAKELVEAISREARNESLSFADQQVALAAAKLRDARNAVQAFRSQENVIDPTEDVKRIYEQISLIEQKLIETQAERDTVLAAQGQNSARAKQLTEQIAALRKSLGEVEDKIDERLPELSRAYEALITEREITLQTYSSALQARQQAEAIATQRQVYLSVYDPPKAAEASLYPDRPWLILYLFGALTAIWGIGYVLVLNIRDAMV
ncbi:MAG: hypothetical protein AAFW46_11135 [Pseudomonadota bacterium]